MDCLVWASRVARTPDDEVPLAILGPSVEQQVIGEEEKGRIRNFRLEDIESDREVSDQVKQSMAVADSSEEEGDCYYSDGWEKTLERISQLKTQQPSHSLKQNKTALIYQFENNMFHLQFGTRN